MTSLVPVGVAGRCTWRREDGIAKVLVVIVQRPFRQIENISAMRKRRSFHARGRLSSSGRKKHGSSCPGLPPPWGGGGDEASIECGALLLNESQQRGWRPASHDGARLASQQRESTRNHGRCAEGDCGDCTSSSVERRRMRCSIRACEFCHDDCCPNRQCALHVEGLAGPDGAIHPR